MNQQDLLLASFSGRHRDTPFHKMVTSKLLIGGGKSFWHFNITNRTKINNNYITVILYQHKYLIHFIKPSF